MSSNGGIKVVAELRVYGCGANSARHVSALTMVSKIKDLHPLCLCHMIIQLLHEEIHQISHMTSTIQYPNLLRFILLMLEVNDMLNQYPVALIDYKGIERLNILIV